MVPLGPREITSKLESAANSVRSEQSRRRAGDKKSRGEISLSAARVNRCVGQVRCDIKRSPRGTPFELLRESRARLAKNAGNVKIEVVTRERLGRIYIDPTGAEVSAKSRAVVNQRVGLGWRWELEPAG